MPSAYVRVPAACSLRSAVTAGDIVPGPLLVRVGEDLAGLPELDQLAQVEEGGALRNARRLLHVVGEDHDREALAQLVDQFLDLGRRDRVERGGGFVKQQDFGPHCDGACDTQSLLLTARQRQGAVVELV